MVMNMWQAAQAKKEKEAVKKAIKKERKNFRTICKVRTKSGHLSTYTYCFFL